MEAELEAQARHVGLRPPSEVQVKTEMQESKDELGCNWVQGLDEASIVQARERNMTVVTSMQKEDIRVGRVTG